MDDVEIVEAIFESVHDHRAMAHVVCRLEAEQTRRGLIKCLAQLYEGRIRPVVQVRPVPLYPLVDAA